VEGQKELYNTLLDLQADSEGVLRQDDEAWSDEESNSTEAWFYLGFAAAMRILDKPSSSKPIEDTGENPKWRIKGSCTL
jgi:hypothetical protein